MWTGKFSFSLLQSKLLSKLSLFVCFFLIVDRPTTSNCFLHEFLTYVSPLSLISVRNKLETGPWLRIIATLPRQERPSDYYYKIAVKTTLKC